MMALWLTRRLDVDLSTVDAGKDKRKKREEEEQYLLWLMLVPADQLPSPEIIQNVLSVLSRGGFDPTEENRMYTVYPADIARDELAFSTLPGVADQLAVTGGGLLFKGRGAGIALVCDPHGRTRQEVIRRVGLDESISFGEFSIWMPRPDPKGVTHEEAAAAILAILPRLQILTRASCCFAITTDDLAGLAPRWPYHRLVSETGKLTELFWYQSFSSELTSDVPIEDYLRAGCTNEVFDGGVVAIQLSELPGTGLAKLAAARDRWLYSFIPRRVC